MKANHLEALLEEQPEGDLTPRTRRPVLRMVARTIRSGDLTEVECYPVYDKLYERQLRKVHSTAQAQRTVNDRNARKKFERLAELNFKAGIDYAMTLTYDKAPTDDRQLDKDLRNYLNRINRARKKAGLPRAKCIGVKQRGDKNGRLHHHLLISGGIDRDEMERLWGHGIANCDRIQQRKGGLTAITKYMTRGFDTKRDTGRHRYFYTRNLQQHPRITESRHRVSVRQAERIREDADLYAEQVFRAKYPGLVLESVTAKTTAWMPGVYIYARLRRAEHEPS